MLQEKRLSVRPRVAIALAVALVPVIGGLGLAATALASGRTLPAEEQGFSPPFSGTFQTQHIQIMLLVNASTSGGNVTYTYQVSNPGSVALGSVTVTDKACKPVTYVSGDTNKDGWLQPGEYWIYTCTTALTATTTDAATASGTGLGTTVGTGNATTVTVGP
ncbi:MAG: hypothetical protein ACLQBX_08675 [Candidatus Limnocylindrales bacterium]